MDQIITNWSFRLRKAWSCALLCREDRAISRLGGGGVWVRATAILCHLGALS